MLLRYIIVATVECGDGFLTDGLVARFSLLVMLFWLALEFTNK